MNPPGQPTQPENHRLIFRWPERSASFVLPTLFVLSVAAHALTFYVFQVVYPPTVSIAPPPAQVTLLTPSNPQNEALLRWIDAQDPANARAMEEALPPGLGEIHYTPSYATVHTLPKPVEHEQEPTAFPPAHDPLELIAPAVAHTEKPFPAVHSSLSFSETLRGRDAAPGAPVTVLARSSTSLPPSVFLVGISDRGEVRYCFLQEGSGHRAIDTEAEELLRKHDFKRVEGAPPLTWGFATFIWGADAFAPPSVPGEPGASGSHAE